MENQIEFYNSGHCPAIFEKQQNIFSDQVNINNALHSFIWFNIKNFLHFDNFWWALVD